MIYCWDCESFGEPKTIDEWTGVYAPDGTAETILSEVCSYCGSGDIQTATPCTICGEYFPPDDNVWCDVCKFDVSCSFEELFSSVSKKVRRAYPNYPLNKQNRQTLEAIEEIFDSWADIKSAYLKRSKYYER